MTKKPVAKKSAGWLPVLQALGSSQIVCHWNSAVQTLAEYIEKRRDAFEHTADDLTKPMLVKLPPIGDIGSVFLNLQAVNFVVLLSQKKIIANVQLPVSIRKINQENMELATGTIYLSEDAALEAAIYSTENFLKELVSFDLINWKGFVQLKQELIDAKEKAEKGEQPAETIATLAHVSYNSESGIGFVDGKRFKFKDDQPEYLIFTRLTQQINQKLSRVEVLHFMGFTENREAPGLKLVSNEKATYAINELAKKIRKATGLNVNTLVVNNGSLTLAGKLDPTPNHT